MLIGWDWMVLGHEVFSFAYDKRWLDKGNAQGLDSDLQFYAGSHYLGVGEKNFGIFLDSSPDRWGRVLMARREAIHARMAARKEKKHFLKKTICLASLICTGWGLCVSKWSPQGLP
jgi:hypothetical protein